VLVLSRLNGLDCLEDAKEEHLPMLRSMHSTGVKWVKKFLSEDPSLIFRLGYHSVRTLPIVVPRQNSKLLNLPFQNTRKLLKFLFQRLFEFCISISLYKVA
jgi:Scavenger mRNA decapping enzyme C-term binding